MISRAPQNQKSSFIYLYIYIYIYIYDDFIFHVKKTKNIDIKDIKIFSCTIYYQINHIQVSLFYFLKAR
jgi:hypothetical protein